MAAIIGRPCYCTREMVAKALDIKFSARAFDAVDRAIESAADNIDGELHRQFYPEDKTCKFDFPNWQYADPWRLYLERNELADVTTKIPVVVSGGVTLSASDLIWYPLNQAPPYSWVETSRASSTAFGIGSTPQQDISITGTFGYWIRTKPAGTLAAAMSDTVSTSAQVSDGSSVGVGDVLIVGSERMIVTDKNMVTSTQSQQGSGAGTASKADVTLAVTDGTKFTRNEVLLLDSERMLIVDIAGNNLTVIRAWDGTVLATHSSATIFAARLLTVTRGDLGSTAATHSNGAPCVISYVPPLVRDLSIAEASVQNQMELGAYAGTQGEGSSAIRALGEGLADKWDEVRVKYGRQLRIGAI